MIDVNRRNYKQPINIHKSYFLYSCCCQFEVTSKEKGYINEYPLWLLVSVSIRANILIVSTSFCVLSYLSDASSPSLLSLFQCFVCRRPCYMQISISFNLCEDLISTQLYHPTLITPFPSLPHSDPFTHITFFPMACVTNICVTYMAYFLSCLHSLGGVSSTGQEFAAFLTYLRTWTVQDTLQIFLR